MNGPELLAALVAEGLPIDLADQASASTWSDGSGGRYALHHHVYDKVLVATSGAITFELPERGTAVTLVPGGRLELPSGTRHAALVGPAGVACLELHLPAGSLAHLDPARRTDRPAAT